MFPAWPPLRDRLRPWLILGRVSNLPTIWSNCLAAWLLGGGGSIGRLVWVMIGGSLVYVGGMFLNDAFDFEFDRIHRRERPIPSGEVALGPVWVAGFGLLLAGWVCMARLGGAGLILGLLLILLVVVYDAVHKSVALSPLLMASCRTLLFLVAGSAGADGIVGGTVWSGLVLGVYVVGVSYVARKESAGGVLSFWPFLLLLAPLGMAACVNAPSTWGRADVLIPLVLFGIWTIRCVTRLRARSGGEGIRLAVSGLLAGIVWVDVVAVMPPSWPWGGLFLVLFGLSLVFQKVVPPT